MSLTDITADIAIVIIANGVEQRPLLVGDKVDGTHRTEFLDSLELLHLLAVMVLSAEQVVMVSWDYTQRKTEAR